MNLSGVTIRDNVKYSRDCLYLTAAVSVSTFFRYYGKSAQSNFTKNQSTME